MATPARYLYLVMMDVEPEKEADFNRVYDTEHIPALLRVPGVLSATRYRTATDGVPRYAALYEIENPDVPQSEAFQRAANSGEWPVGIRPHTHNHKRIVYTRIEPKR
jgi:hypothetical protein